MSVWKKMCGVRWEVTPTHKDPPRGKTYSYPRWSVVSLVPTVDVDDDCSWVVWPNNHSPSICGQAGTLEEAMRQAMAAYVANQLTQ